MKKKKEERRVKERRKGVKSKQALKINRIIDRIIDKINK